MDSATIDGLFEALKKDLIPFVKEILAKPDIAGLCLGLHVGLIQIGGNALVAVEITLHACDDKFPWHPFTLNFCSKDVRLTNHYYENNPLSSIFSAVHEGPCPPHTG